MAVGQELWVPYTRQFGGGMLVSHRRFMERVPMTSQRKRCNDRIKAVTGVEFRPFDESLRDCVESLLAVAKVKPKQRKGFSLPA